MNQADDRSHEQGDQLRTGTNRSMLLTGSVLHLSGEAMKTTGLTLISAIALALAVAPAFAADDDTVAALDKSEGSIMASDGSEGEFLPTQLGQRFKAGDRLMVAENSEVTIKYDNNCDKTYKKPGVYPVDSDCVAGWLGTKEVVFLSVAGAGAIYGIVKDDDEAARPPPISR